MPSGTRVEGPRGEIYVYSANLNAGYMTLWNMSAFVSMAGSWGSAFSNREFNVTTGASRSMGTNGQFGTWSSSGAADRVARAWAWNITIPPGLTGSIRAINWTDGRVVGGNLNATDIDNWAFAIQPIGTESPLPRPTSCRFTRNITLQDKLESPHCMEQPNSKLGTHRLVSTT